MNVETRVAGYKFFNVPPRRSGILSALLKCVLDTFCL